MPEPSTVDLYHWLQNRVDSYTIPAWEAALVELVANCLDAKCSEIRVTTDPRERVLQLCDNGQGMNEREFQDYHNVSFSQKRKGRGIGWAGEGAKLALWVSDSVITETESRYFRGASKWWLEGNGFWRDPVPERTLTDNGTKTTLLLKEASPLLRKGELERIITTHYYPLFDPLLSEIYRITQIYPLGIHFLINGRAFVPDMPLGDKAVKEKHEFALQVMRGRTKRILGRGYFILSESELEQPGVVISTWGKVIKRGEWFRKFPRDMERIWGIIEAPYLIESLTTNKLDFITQGETGKNWRHFYKEMQKVFGEWLEQVGRLEKKRAIADEAASLEKEISEILPLVPDLQTIFVKNIIQDVPVPDASGLESFSLKPGTQIVSGTQRGQQKGAGVPIHPGPDDGTGPEEATPEGPRGTRVLRNIKSGPKIAFLSLPDQPELGFVDGDTVVLNSGHPAYEKAQRRGAVWYHHLMSVAWALTQEKGAESSNEGLALLGKFFTAWGKL